jgi:hypothetical protein
MKNQVIRKLIDVEIRLGFLHIPADGIELMPSASGKISVALSDGLNNLTYNAERKRIFGLTKWYRKHRAKVGDEVHIEKTGGNYTLRFQRKETPAESQKEAEHLIDISGLSSQAKGDIVEDRMKELIVLQGQGLLSVYRPVTDTHGIDLIVTKTGMFQPIFLQVKSRFNVQKRGYFLMDIGKKTFDAHHSYFVIGAYFNPKALEIDENLLLVPSVEVQKANIVKPRTGERYRITCHLNKDSRGKWARYLIKKADLANKLLEKFEEMGKYIK